MESFLTGRVAKLGLDEEAFVPYLASLASDSESEESLRERLQTALENIGAENFSSFLDEFVAFCEGLSEHEKHRQEQQEIEARSQAEKALLATKVLRGNVETPAVAANKDETPEERKKRLVCSFFLFFPFFLVLSFGHFCNSKELLARYDVPDEIVMDASGKVLVRDVSEKTQINVDGNDNQERVRQAELEQVWFFCGVAWSSHLVFCSELDKRLKVKNKRSFPKPVHLTGRRRRLRLKKRDVKKLLKWKEKEEEEINKIKREL